MAAVQKRKNSYRAQVRRKGKSVSATFDTKQEAMDWAAQAEAKLLQGSSIERIKSAPADPSASTGAEMLRRYSDEVFPLKRGGPWEQVRLKKLARDYDIFRQPATLISGPDMARWRDKRLKEVQSALKGGITVSGHSFIRCRGGSFVPLPIVRFSGASNP